MRTVKKQREKMGKKKETKFRLKKVAVFILTFSFVVGLVAVDEAYSEIMGKAGVLSLQTRRTDQDCVTFSLLGEETIINVSDVEAKIGRFQNQGANVLEDFSDTIREYLGLGEWPRKDLPFQSKIL